MSAVENERRREAAFSLPAGAAGAAVLLRRIVCCGTAFLFFCLPLFGPRPACGAQLVRVLSCPDGDTLRLEDGRAMRLAGIDCPELGHGKEPDRHYAREARRAAERLAAGKRVRLIRRGGGEDRYGRIVGEALLPDGQSLNALLVREGAAFVYWHAELPEDFFERLLRAQRSALEARRGLWRELLRGGAATERYVGNARSRRFFSARCEGADRIRAGRKRVFNSLEAAFAAGFAPARHCDIVPAALKCRAHSYGN